jgi:hypothetical protein|nr:MAG TPA: hypothetical protein [Caudoviricetes sp.]
MNATTVNQFAQRCDALAQSIAKLHGNAERVRALAAWLLAQGEARNALDMDVREFMARCPAAVRDAARVVMREAQTLLRALRTRAANKVMRKRKAAPEKQRSDLMSDEDYAEMLQRMDPFEAARIQREE